eukprot:CAMPEP_0179977048 /NCGR_PEP_ID=MMETSP0983-20121128/39792_1 /TAXON_ID=483367 /ORGANISM="non described non described, Strain CCMP 2436" /LENGTH=40 /DNA_ID= /DNA_START= /DNA_END= /DNA_ORIENTATION=
MYAAASRTSPSLGARRSPAAVTRLGVAADGQPAVAVRQRG